MEIMILVLYLMTLFLFQTILTLSNLTQFKVTLFQTYAVLKEIKVK